MKHITLRWAIAVTMLAASTPLMASPDCAGLQRLTMRGVTVAAEAVTSGSFAPSTGRGLTNLRPFCRVAGVITPAAGSSIRFEVWMPMSGWTGRFQGVGNFGFGGELSFEAMAGALRRGDAVAATDTGHQSSDWMSAAWAPGHPARVVDFGYRAIHETAVAAKTFIQAFYGSKPIHSYFSSCSNGGRQALMEAQRYPTDYDGIIAGAPALDFTRLLAHAAWLVNLLLGDEAGHVPAEKLRAIQAAALAACDRRDGVLDGIIGEPESCRLDVAALVCRGPDAPGCLTPAQLASIEKLYSGSRTSAGRTFLTGYFPGGEAEPGGWAHWLTGPPATMKVTYGGPTGTATWRTQTPAKQTLAYAFATQFFSNMVFEKPDWDIFSFNLDRDSRTAETKLAVLLNATDADLRPFEAHGGKLLLYHGWNDAGVPPLGTVEVPTRASSKESAAQRPRTL